jgi:glycyl-tRNA synthetase beta chain
MPTLLLELFSEEIPSRMQRSGAEQLSRLMNEGFKKNMLALAECKTFVSPRHLAIQCFGLPAIQPDVKEERRGPKIGAPEQALKGFLQSTGLTLEQCEQRDGYYYATIERKGRAVAEVVKEIIETALSAFVWPKSMKWGARPMQWVRPLHSITCLLDDAVVPVQFGHLTAGNVTHGHRFLAPAPITISHAEKYEELLKDAFVVVDFEKRKNYIGNAVHNLAVQHGLQVIDDNALLDEVTGLVEWPVPLLCEFDAKFLDLPPEVLISEMKNHQRYFALYGADGKLTNRFITVANMVNADGGARVKDGNGRVVRARLADGEFYWNQDRLTKLEDWGKKLSDVVFHAKVGMMDKKVERIEARAVEIANALTQEVHGGHASVNLDDIRRTAKLCKADLTSGMVGEFPELQGIMGRYYATAQGERDEVADAIRDHYKPQGANDTLPESPLAAIIAIADKLDSITSLFAAGEKPTGSKDPLALRRAALGINNILIDMKWSLDLSAFASTEVIEFMADRLRQNLKDKGIRHDVIESKVSTAFNFSPASIYRDAIELSQWLATDCGKETVAAIKRCLNILASEEKKDKKLFAASIAGTKAPAEKALSEELDGFSPIVPQNLEALTAPINQFFTDLMVTEEGKRDARLSLLAAVRDAANTIADFSKIEG